MSSVFLIVKVSCIPGWPNTHTQLRMTINLNLLTCVCGGMCVIRASVHANVETTGRYKASSSTILPYSLGIVLY